MHQEPSPSATTGRPPGAPRRRSSRKGAAPAVTVSDIEEMDRQTLTALWTRVFGSTPPAQMSRPILRRFLSFEIQARAGGGVSAAVAKKLVRITRGDAPPATPALEPGTRLLREWNGTTHVVEVLDAGFRWNGKTHRSLSAIARAITGARWSGPRFFGLTEQKKARRQ